MDAPDPRREALVRFAREALQAPCEITPAAADASARRYFRLRGPFGTVIGMDAPPPQEDVRPFVRVAGLLARAGVNAPRILAADPAAGFLLLTDFGTDGYLDLLRADPAQADALVADAIAALVRWQAASVPGVLPPYDGALLGRELDLFPEWYVGRHLGIAMTADEAATWQALRGALIARALAQPRVYVHRDYMVRNLMRAQPNPGVLDFQDALEGPLGYDLASLLRDAFLSFTPAQEARWIERYWHSARAAGVPVPDTLDALHAELDWIATQRHLKVLGIFARLKHRDGKPAYLEDAPRFVGYIRAAAARRVELAPLAALLEALHARAGRVVHAGAGA